MSETRPDHIAEWDWCPKCKVRAFFCAGHDGDRPGHYPKCSTLQAVATRHTDCDCPAIFEVSE